MGLAQRKVEFNLNEQATIIWSRLSQRAGIEALERSDNRIALDMIAGTNACLALISVERAVYGTEAHINLFNAPWERRDVLWKLVTIRDEAARNHKDCGDSLRSISIELAAQYRYVRASAFSTYEVHTDWLIRIADEAYFLIQKYAQLLPE